MLIVAALFALIAVTLIVASWLQYRLFADALRKILADAREERAQLVNKIARPETPMSSGRPIPKVPQRRSPENARDFARIGTVAPSRPSDEAS